MIAKYGFSSMMALCVVDAQPTLGIYRKALVSHPINSTHMLFAKEPESDRPLRQHLQGPLCQNNTHFYPFSVIGSRVF